jgi:hypothetical protein
MEARSFGSADAATKYSAHERRAIRRGKGLASSRESTSSMRSGEIALRDAVGDAKMLPRLRERHLGS